MDTYQDTLRAILKGVDGWATRSKTLVAADYAGEHGDRLTEVALRLATTSYPRGGLMATKQFGCFVESSGTIYLHLNVPGNPSFEKFPGQAWCLLCQDGGPRDPILPEVEAQVLSLLEGALAWVS
jgi:hypothetical protein